MVGQLKNYFFCGFPKFHGNFVRRQLRLWCARVELIRSICARHLVTSMQLSNSSLPVFRHTYTPCFELPSDIIFWTFQSDFFLLICTKDWEKEKIHNFNFLCIFLYSWLVNKRFLKNIVKKSSSSKVFFLIPATQILSKM